MQSAAALAREKGAEALIALRGESPMDCSKAAAILAPQGGKVRDYEDSSRIVEEILPLYTVPSTAGTGSEVTFSAVITDRQQGKVQVHRKISKNSPPGRLYRSAAHCFNAFRPHHAIEAFTARNATPLSDTAALHAAGLIDSFLVRAVKTPEDMKARAGRCSAALSQV